MRFRAGVVIGFAAGYYLGAKAGRERYEQMRGALARARRSRPMRKARALVEIGVERIRRETVDADDLATEIVLDETYTDAALDDQYSPN